MVNGMRAVDNILHYESMHATGSFSNDITC